MNIEKQLLAITQEFISELESQRAHRVVTLESSLAKDLGIDSLEKVELFMRLENAFEINLGDEVITEVEYIKDLIAAIQDAKPLQELKKTAKVYQTSTVEYDPSTAKSLVAALEQHAKADPERVHVYLRDAQGHEQVIRYGQLLKMATKVATGLQQLGLRRNETVAIMLPTSSNFFFAFFGVLLAGCIPVPIYPPYRPDKIEEYVLREALIFRNAGVRVLITFHRAETLSHLLQPLIPSLTEVTTVENLRNSSGKYNKVNIEPSDPALIQYTSGSTSAPKGVLLTHANLLANIRGIAKALQMSPADTGVSWLPLYHDMGLIGAWLSYLYHGYPITIFSPLAFIMRPERWLWAIHHHRGTISAAPNFAFELCIKKIDPKSIQGLDLSSLRLLLNGAEEVNPSTIRRFTEKFAPYGFRADAFLPVYGLAECSVGLAFPPIARTPVIDRIIMQTFHEHDIAEPATTDTKHTLEFASCGIPLEGHQLKIVDEHTGSELPERHVGKLKFRGPSASDYYYNNPEGTKKSLQDGWWDSGDLAYIADGEVYIAGRKKDIIVKAGRNYYPQEIEEVTANVPGVRKGCVIAFGIQDKKWGTEKIVIIAETKERQSKKKTAIINQISEQVATAITVPPDEIILVPPRTVPKTSSGKLKRSALKQAYEQNRIRATNLPIAVQIAKIGIRSAVTKTTTILKLFLKLIYTAYVATIFCATGIIIWLLLFLVPTTIIQKTLKCWARTLFFIAGCRVEISGSENIQANQSMIILANHISYSDVVLLSLITPSNTRFIGKQELLKVPFLCSFLKRLNFVSVDRADFSKNAELMQTMQNILEQENSLVIFPEGTFSYPQEMRPFKVGAFKLAVETNTPIIPIKIVGTDKLLPVGDYLLQPTKLSLTIAEKIEPQDSGHEEINNLRSQTRAQLEK